MGSASLLEGCGGSEEAVIHIARNLQLTGCDVTVYGRPGHFAGTYDGVHWVPHQSFRGGACGDVFIAWRDAQYVALGERWGQVHHWLHNRQEWDYPPEIAARVDRILLVSRHHGTDSGFDEVPREKLFYTSNGLDEAFLRDPGRNEADRAIYASCPARGLVALLDMWPAIKRRVPTAKLDIYNGFTAVYDDMAGHFPGLHYIRQMVLDRIDQDGVSFHGVVGQDRLAEAFARAGTWVYPTECRETSCITAMKALAMGCLPVTSGYGAITETLGGRDLGPAHPEKLISASRLRMWRFRRRVVWAMRYGGSEEMHQKSLEWAHWAREQYSWQRIAQQWRGLFDQVAVEKRERGLAAAGRIACLK